MTERTPGVLVIHDTPEDFRATLDGRFPDVPIRYATNAAEVLAGLEAGRPDVVFSIKHSGFPGPAHRPAIDFPSVRWVHVGGSGYEHFVPWDPARVTLSNSLGLLARVHAESVMGAILAFNRGFLDYRDLQRRRTWAPATFPPLDAQTILVVGMGAIGAEVARLAKAFGLRVIGVRRGGARHPAADETHGPDALPRLLGQADIVSVHLRLSPETAGMIGRAAFAAMKPGAMLVNTARGAVVEEAALVEALRSGRVGRAYLDVFAVEPLPADSPLWDFDNVLISPHACENVADWGVRCAGFFAQNLARWMRGEPLLNVVAP
jgi:phosphoglycerate dehydrogenase-like enzyme